MPAASIVVHGHFYQPPRENPWTEEVAREPSAAPFHDWNARIAAEAYRPNAFARVVDERGRVVDIVNNYEHISFDVGPTLTAWLSHRDPETLRRIQEGDAKGGGAIAQTFFHIILPLATERDARTQVRWGIAEFAHRFGRPAEGIWLPETAVDDMVLRVLAEEDVSFTILAPTQAAAPVDIRHGYRWHHPSGDGRGVDVVFYHGPLSHSIAFELGALTSQAFLDRVQEAAADSDGIVAIAADGETFGHHHHWGDRLLAYALAVEAPARGVDVSTTAEFLRRCPPSEPVEVVESAWSCVHGVGRWREDCGCSTGGDPTWNQAWRGPLRAALDVVHDAVDEVFERRGSVVLADPWAARDAYVEVLIGTIDRDEFASRHVVGDPVEALTLLEAQRHSMAMYTSCGWFFNDLAGLETLQVLRYAARAIDCLAEIGEQPPVETFLETLAQARSNIPHEGDGRDIWIRHVESARVDPERVVAHVALIDLLQGGGPTAQLAAFTTEVEEHDHADRGVLALCSGRVSITHRRTGRRTEHVYAALHLGGLEVLGAVRSPDPARDELAFRSIREAFGDGTRVTTLLRLVSEGFGPREFGLGAALPDAAEQILSRSANALADRFAAAYDRLFSDHRSTLVALAAAGFPLPAELRAPAELALGRRLEAEVAGQAGSLDPDDYRQAAAIAREAQASGFVIDTPVARSAVERLLVRAVERAVADGGDSADAAIAGLRLARELDLHPSLDRAQEIVHEALASYPEDEKLLELAVLLGLAPPNA